MNKRCIVNFADGEFYTRMQLRLMETFAPCTDTTFVNGSKLWSRDPLHNFESTGALQKFKGIDLLLWKHLPPPGARSHAESPYGFKVHAIKAAYKMGYTSILWLDSQAYAVKEDISPIFDKIEKEGYYAMSHNDQLERFVGRFALQHYQIPRRNLDGYNLPSGSCYGFDMEKQGFAIMVDMMQAERDGFFRSEVEGEIVHRHDEAILGLTLIRHGLPLFINDPLFQSDSLECVIRSGDFGPMEQAR